MQEFEALTADLYRLADWLTDCGVETVAIIVHRRVLDTVVRGAGRTGLPGDASWTPDASRTCRGRKSEVVDWCCNSCTPTGSTPGPFGLTRIYAACATTWRQRTMLVEYASHHVQHMQKALTEMNVKRQHVISDVHGQRPAWSIIEAIVSERNPRRLARLRDPRPQGGRGDHSPVAHGGTGGMTPSSSCVELYRVYQGKIAECDREIKAQLAGFEEQRRRTSGSQRKRRTRPASMSRASCTG